MNRIIKKSLLAIAILGSIDATAQQPLNQDRPVAPAPGNTPPANKDWKPSLVNDGVIDRMAHEYRVMPWRSIRELDVAYYHRVWKEIPVREKQNQAFLYEGDEFSNGGAFIEILNNAVKTGQIVAYSSFDDKFTQVISEDKLATATGGGTMEVEVPDLETGEVTYVTKDREFDINSVTKFLVKEDWVFDRNLGRQVVRIVGIAPLMDRKNAQTGEYIGSSVMYWIHYPSAREVLGKYEVYNPDNLVKRMTWADYLEGGYYSSYITKYSKNNPQNLNLKSQASDNSLRAIKMGEDVLNDLIEQEQYMWER